MTTLKSIVENIAYTFKQEFNEVMKASISDSVIDYRALLIRRDLERNTGSITPFTDSFCVEMELVDSSACPGIITGTKVLRSKQTLPKSIRLKNMGRSDYRYVGTVTRTVPFVYAVPEEVIYVCDLSYQKYATYYTVLDNRLFLLNTNKPCKVLVEGIIEDPRDINDCDNSGLLPDEKVFACPADLLVGIKNSIKKEYFPNLISDGEEVNIDKDAAS